MDRPGFWIFWGIIALVLAFIIGMIIDDFGIALGVSIAIIIIIWIIWYFVDKWQKENTEAAKKGQHKSTPTSNTKNSVSNHSTQNNKKPDTTTPQMQKATQQLQLKIGEAAFSGREDFFTITIPEIVTFIGFRAFYGCKNLSYLEIPKSVITVGDYAFGNCTKL